MEEVTEERLMNELGKGESKDNRVPGSRSESSVQVFPLLSVCGFTNKTSYCILHLIWVCPLNVNKFMTGKYRRNLCRKKKKNIVGNKCSTQYDFD